MRSTFWMSVASGLLLVPAPVLAKCEVGQMLEMKVTMEGKQPMVSSQINGSEKKFLVDSGAFFSTITPGTAAELGLKLTPLPPSYVIKGVGGETSASLATVKAFGLSGLTLNNIRFIVGGSEVSGSAGLLGQNVLGIADVEYDLEHGAIRLMRARDCKDTIPAYWAGTKPVSTVTIDPRDAQHPHTIGTVLVNNVRMRATFDTGAATSVMSLAAAERAGIKPDSPGVRRAGYSSGIGKRTVATYIVPIDSIKLGDQEEIRRTHIQAAAIGLDTDMLIGADFFLSHRVYVANGQHRLYFTYDGGPVFNVNPGRVVTADGSAAQVAADDTAAPTDAEGFSRRGAAFMARREYAKALADYDRACTLAPAESRYFYQRAQAHMALRQPLLAMDDLDQTLKLAPGDAEARLTRASIRLARHDRAAAEEDVAAIDRAVAPAADTRLALGSFYDTLDQPEKALGQYDLWLRYHPDDSRKPSALNGRCWARANLGTDLGKALSDCDAAVKARPTSASYLDSRGLVRLRMGDNAKALRDYDAALALSPKSAWSLYGRGIARQRIGLNAEGEQDVAAAVAIDPKLPARAKQIGLTPRSDLPS